MMSLLLISALISGHASDRKIKALYFTFASKDGSRIEFYTSKKYILQMAEYAEEEGRKYVQLFDREQKKLRTVSLELGVACEVLLNNYVSGKNHSPAHDLPLDLEKAIIDTTLVRDNFSDFNQTCLEEIFSIDNNNPYLEAYYEVIVHRIYCRSNLLNKYFNDKEDWSMAGLYRNEEMSTGFWWLFHTYAYPKNLTDSFLYSEELVNVKEERVSLKKFTDLLIIPTVSVDEYRELLDDYSRE